jgi:hypothetical protein
MNVCIRQLELARKRLMTEGRISEKDAMTAAHFIEDGEVCVCLLDNLSWDGTVPSRVSDFTLHAMQTIAEHSDDTLEVYRD